MASSTELRHLLRVLDERNVPIDPDDVTQAFQSEETRHSISAWVQEYLSPANLLTKEEFAFHKARPESVSGRSTEDKSARPLSDDEFEAAIKSLEASTSAIERQCAVLETQKQALAELKAQHSSEAKSSSRQDERQKKLAREKAQLDFEVAELADGLQIKLQASRKQADTSLTSLPSSVDRVLEKDDRLLDGLQKLLPKLAKGDADQDVSAEVDRLCDSLAILSAREIRARVDAAFRRHASFSEEVTNRQTSKQAEKQIVSLRAELDELSSEIDGLATMAVDNQYRAPITRELKSAGGDAENDRARWSDYLVDTLQYLTTRLTTLQEHSQHLRAHQTVLSQVEAAFKSALAEPEKKKQESQAAMKSPATPTARGLKPLRLVEANLAEPQDPVAQVLRSFDIRIADPNDTDKLAETLQQATTEREKRLAELGDSTERSIINQLSETITKADLDIRELSSAVYGYSQYSSIRLMDGEVQQRLSELEQMSSDLGDAIRVLDIDGLCRSIREKQKRALEAAALH